MKAVRLVRGGQSLTDANVSIPEIGPADVLIGVAAARVCHSDAHYRAGISKIDNLPLTLGHEVAGRARFKRDIKPMGRDSEEILALWPVSFRYREGIDPSDEQQFGLLAEDVKKIDPELVTCAANGQSYTVRYEAVNAMLLNEFLKARHQIDSQQKQIDALISGLQQVSTQLN